MVKLQFYFTLVPRSSAYAVSQLSTHHQTTSIKQESREEKPSINPGKKISTLYFLS